MAKFKFTPVLLDGIAQTARIGDGAAGADPLTANDVGKFLKLVGDSQYGLCAAADAIEATLETHASPIGTYDGFVLGTIRKGGRMRVTCGVSLAVGDYVVAGTVVARGTALSGPPTVGKEGATPDAFRWRVVSLDGAAGVGQTGVIECVSGAGTGTNAA